MIKWRDLSIKKKFITIFILQNITLIIVSIIFGVDLGLSFAMFIALLISIKNDKYSKIKYNKKTFFIITICLFIVFCLSYNWNFIKNFNTQYDSLQDYSGKNIDYISNTKSNGLNYFYLKKDKEDMKMKVSFSCSPIYIDDCGEEIRQYFGTGHNFYGHDISVKYSEFPVLRIAGFIPTIYQEKIIYEIKHNDNIIYSYDYFVNKYSKQKKNLKIFAVYLILHTFGFLYFYHLIQKNFIK